MDSQLEYTLLNPNLATFSTQYLNHYRQYLDASKMIVKLMYDTIAGNHFILTGIPAYSTNAQLTYRDSIIIVSIFKSSNDIIEASYLNIDDKLLSKLNNYKTTGFRLVDFKVSTQGSLFILDEQLGVFQLELSSDQTRWVLTNMYQSYGATQYFSFDIYFTNKVHYIAIATNDNKYTQISNDQTTMFYTQMDISNFNTRFYFNDVQNLIVDTKDYIYYYCLSMQLSSGQLKKLDINSIILSNQYQSEILMVNSISSQTYDVSYGKLVLNSNSESTNQNIVEIKVVATNNKVQCQCIITYTIFDYLDNNLYRSINSKDILMPVITYPQRIKTQIFTGNGVTGPNVQVTGTFQQQHQLLNVDINYIENVRMDGIQWPSPENIQFVSMFTLSSSQIYYMLQSTDRQCKIYSCRYYYYSSNFKCIVRHEFNPNRYLDENTFQWSNSNQKATLLFGYISKFSHTVEFYSIDSTDVKKMFVITTSLMDEDSYITAFNLNSFNIFLILGKQHIVNIYSYTLMSFKWINQINKSVLESQGYMDNFEPRQLYIILNDQRKLIILNNKSVIFITYQSDIIINTIMTYSNAQQLQIAIGTQTLLVIIIGNKKQEIIRYDITSFNRIKQESTIPLNHYKLQSPLQVYSLQSMNLVLIRAYTPVIRKTVLMLFSLNLSLRDSLLTLIETNSYVEDMTKIIVGCVKYSQHTFFLHLSTGIEIKTLIVHDSLLATILPVIQQDSTFVYDSVFQLNFHNIDSPLTVQFEQMVTFINLQTTITANVMNIQEQQLKIYDESATQLIPIAPDWFYGWIMQYSIECYQCPEIVNVQQTVQPIYTTHYQNAKKLHGFCSYNSTLTIILSDQELLFLDSDDKIVFPNYQIKFMSNELCNTIYCSDNQQYIVLGCIHNQELTIKFIECDFNSECSQFNNGSASTWIEQIDQILIVKDNLIIMARMYINSASFLVFAQIVKTKHVIMLRDTQQLGSTYFDKQSLVLSDMTIYPINFNGNTNYKLLVTESDLGIYIIDCSLQYATLKATQFQLINLQQVVLQNYKLNILTNAKCLGIVSTHKPYYSIKQGTIHLKFVVTTTISAHFGLEIVLQNTVYQEILINYIIERYADWVVEWAVVATSSYIAMVYYGLTMTDTITICVYKIPQNQQQDITINPVMAIGGISIPCKVLETYYFYLTTTFYGDTYLHYSQYENQMVVCQVNDQATIVVNNGLEYQAQPITLIANNAVADSASMDIRINKYDVANQSNTLLYLLITISLLVTLLIAWYCIQKYKEQRKKQCIVVDLLE